MQTRLTRLVMALLVTVLTLPTTPATAQAPPVPGPCQRFAQTTGAIGLICVPAQGWNGDLVVFAHGYVAFDQPLDLQHLTLPDGTFVPTLVQQLGFAFATSSYRQNGLAILEGADDLRALVPAFRARIRAPRHTYVAGISAGGLVAALLAERSPQLFDGALSACGPIGDFRAQTDYLGDFRVLFDYFFPWVIPGSAVRVPAAVIAGWEGTYLPAVRRAVAANPRAAQELISAAHAAVDPADPATVQRTITNVLWYDVFATNDATAKLGGNPYQNVDRFYFGSSDDLLLNLAVPRFRADAAALANMQRYQTSGQLTIPLVTLHTTGDEVIPFWQQLLYWGKVRTSGRGSWTPIPIFRYGHCNFNADELLGAFGLLVWQVTAQDSAATAQRSSAEQARADFERAVRVGPARTGDQRSTSTPR
jgi:pimeloyl-ACP methyl ester carboxylesterase